MTTRFVQRDAQNKIIGDFAIPQPGIAEEEIDETHADYVAYKTPPPVPQRILDDIAEMEAAKLDSQVMAFLDMTPAQRANWITANVSAAGLTLAQVKAGLDTALNVLGAIAAHGARGRRLR